MCVCFFLCVCVCVCNKKQQQQHFVTFKQQTKFDGPFFGCSISLVIQSSTLEEDFEIWIFQKVFAWSFFLCVYVRACVSGIEKKTFLSALPKSDRRSALKVKKQNARKKKKKKEKQKKREPKIEQTKQNKIKNGGGGPVVD